MNLRQLAYFVAVAEQRSIQKASAVLHISQPSVSTQIKLLEEELQAQLLERRQSGTVLTPEGELFLSYARTALDALDAAKISLRAKTSSEVGKVVVGIPGSLSTVLSLPLVRQVQLECPNIRLKLVSGLSGHLAKWIEDGDVDFGLVHGIPQESGLDFDFLMREHLFLVSSFGNTSLQSKCTAAGDIPFAHLHNLPLVLPGKEHGLRRIVEEQARLVGVKLYIRTELDAHELLAEWVKDTADCAVLSLAALKMHGDINAFFIARIVDPVIERRVSVAYASKRPLSRASRRVEGILRNLLSAEIDKGWWKYATLNT